MDIFVARQPIFDLKQEVFAYELLFRSGPQNFFSHNDQDDAVRRVVDNAFHVFGLDSLSANKKLFINCTKQVLNEDVIGLLPPQLAVVEVLETVEVDDEVLERLRMYKARGHTLALDDFVFRPGMEPLVEMADIIKVDFLLTRGDERLEVIKRFGRKGLKFLAEKVETIEEFEHGKACGYEYFQGYFFAKPQMITAKDVPSSKLTRLRLMRALLDRNVNLDEVEQILKSDVSLSVKLLRYLNSPAFAWREKIASMKHALVLLGDRPFRQWASLVVTTTLGDDKPAELVLTCLVRARFCEQLGVLSGMKPQAFDLFLVGLISCLDALLGRPMPEIIDMLGVSEPVRAALLEGSGQLAPVYQAAVAYSQGDWNQPALIDAAKRIPTLADEYKKAITWAESLIK